MRRFCQRLLCTVLGTLALNFSIEVWAQTVEKSSRSAHTASIAEFAVSELPDSPSVVQAQAQNSTQQSSSGSLASSSQTVSQTGNSAEQQSTTPGQTQLPPPQRPVGTAAAEAPIVSGVTAAQPAGVAVAPAKQRRVRTIVLRVGAIVGAGVAVGTIVALTAGTSSKPPGAR
jgi:hypothetical protein